MPGSWELKANRQVLCAFLHTEHVPVAWALGYRNLQIPGVPLPLSGAPFDHARNTACMETLRHGFQYVFFLDSDVIPPPDAIPRLIAHRQPIISGVYHRRSQPVAVPVLMGVRGWPNLPQGWGMVPPNSGVVEVDLVGAGCLLIHRSVLETLPMLDERRGKHWFDWRSDMSMSPTPPPPGEALSEDFSFCLHARRHGFRILCDTSIQCRHAGLGQATYQKFEPVEYIV